MKLTETKLDELISVAKSENECALLSILYAVKGARYSNTENLLADCVMDAVNLVLLPIVEKDFIRNN